MRLEAVEHDRDVLRREREALDVAPVAGVVEERRVDPLEQPVVDHDLLAAAALFRGRAQEDDLAGQLVRHRRKGDRGAHARCGHRVVATAMAEPGQCVVLGEDPDPGPSPPRPPRRTARTAVARLPAGCSTSKPCCGGLGDPRRRVVLLVGRLGVSVDPVRQLEDLVAGRLDGGSQTATSCRCGARPGVVAVSDGNGRSRLGMVDGASQPPRPPVRRAVAASCGQRSAERVDFGDQREGDDEQRDRQSSTPCTAAR